jgi:hypothetical protein
MRIVPEESSWRIGCIVLGTGAFSDSGMTNKTGKQPDSQPQRRYTWPWFVLAAVLLAIALAVLWMSKEIERTRRIRDLNTPAAPTNRGAISPPPSSLPAVWRA